MFEVVGAACPARSLARPTRGIRFDVQRLRGCRRTAACTEPANLDGERLAGVFSERDYARKVILQGKGSRQTKVSEVMTGKVVYVKQNATIEECMAIMTEKHIRHLPVLDDNQMVVGIVSIGDVVKEMVSQQKFIIGQLENYITG